MSSLDTIRHAYDVAVRWHTGQRRKSGDPYVIHSVAVATIVARQGCGPAAICAALLHDLIGDTPYTFPQMRAEFGDEITRLVEGIYVRPVFHQLMQAVPAEHERVDRASSSLDMPRAPNGVPALNADLAVIKLADRLHNMRTIRHVAPAKQIRASRETLEFAAPIAHFLGLHELKQQLEDLALQVLRPAVTDRPTQILGRILRWTVIALPVDSRARWREEWAAEIAAPATVGQRARYVAQTLLGVPRLALTLHRGRHHTSDGWAVIVARVIRLLGIGGAFVVITTPNALTIWIAGGIALGALILTGAIVFARSDGPAHRLAEIIRAWRH